MNTFDIKKFARNIRAAIGKRIAGADTDPSFFGKLHILPNPDPILRAMGNADAVYASIMADPHVLGELRSIRGSLKQKNYRVVTEAKDNPKAQAAREACDSWMSSIRPNPAADWEEIMWQMMASVLRGYAVHELVWDYRNGLIVPVEILDRPHSRFVFDYDAKPRLITKNNRDGEAVEPYQFIVSRHMASVKNPYGQAVLSSCFWPWTFKTGGWKYFMQYCERHGLPWPVARYSENASDKELGELKEAIENMINSGYALVPDGTGVELLVPNGSNQLPQESLINLANREISKALTGQAMVAELQGAGARAASETAQARQQTINDSDAEIAAKAISQIFRLITDFNFGEDVPAPELELFTQKEAGKERAETYQVAADMGARPSRKGMLEELNIHEAVDDDDALLPRGGQMPENQFSASQKPDVTIDGNSMVTDAIDAADSVIETNVIEPIARMLAQAEKDGKSLADVRNDLVDLLGHVDNTELVELTNKALVWSFTRGYVDGQ